MQDHYRLFFRFASTLIKMIVYVWLKDEETLRKAKSRTDVYEKFKRMLSHGVMPKSIRELLAGARG